MMDNYTGNKMMTDEYAIKYLRTTLQMHSFMSFGLFIDSYYVKLFFIYNAMILMFWIILKLLSYRVLKYNMLLVYVGTSILPYSILLILLFTKFKNIVYLLIFLLGMIFAAYKGVVSDRNVNKSKRNKKQIVVISALLGSVVRSYVEITPFLALIVYVITIYLITWVYISAYFKYDYYNKNRLKPTQ